MIKIYVTYILLMVSLFIGSDTLPFRGEESRRFLMAYEMFFSKDYFNPTVLGEHYFNKPPGFAWITHIMFYIFGFKELSLRLISIISTILSSMIAYNYAFLLTKDRLISSFAGLTFLSFLDVLFWYGFLGEIDMYFTLLLNISILCFYLSLIKDRVSLSVLSGFFAGLSFLTKGFPVFIFAGIFILSMAFLYRNNLKPLLMKTSIAFLIFVSVVSIWLINIEYPQVYLHRLFEEAFSRIESSEELTSDILDDFKFIALNLKQTFPISLIIIFLMIKSRFKIDYGSINLKILYLWFGITYLLFLLFTDSAGRYLLPLFPASSVIFSYLIVKNRREWVDKIILGFILLGFIRIFAGILVPDLYIKTKGDLRLQTKEILSTVDNSPFACDCHSKYEVCSYIAINYGKPVYSSKVMKDFKFKVSCSRQDDLSLIKTFTIGKDNYYLYSFDKK